MRSSTRATCTADHLPRPRAVGMPCSFNPAAMARRLVFPAVCRLLIVGPMSAALEALIRQKAALPAAYRCDHHEKITEPRIIASGTSIQF
jgi:hypothetical protein